MFLDPGQSGIVEGSVLGASPSSPAPLESGANAVGPAADLSINARYESGELHVAMIPSAIGLSTWQFSAIAINDNTQSTVASSTYNDWGPFSIPLTPGDWQVTALYQLADMTNGETVLFVTVPGASANTETTQTTDSTDPDPVPTANNPPGPGFTQQPDGSWTDGTTTAWALDAGGFSSTNGSTFWIGEPDAPNSITSIDRSLLRKWTDVNGDAQEATTGSTVQGASSWTRETEPGEYVATYTVNYASSATQTLTDTWTVNA